MAKWGNASDIVALLQAQAEKKRGVEPGAPETTHLITKDVDGRVGVVYSGNRVDAVTAGSPAAEAGLTPGVRMVSVEGVPIPDDTNALAAALTAAPQRFRVTVVPVVHPHPSIRHDWNPQLHQSQHHQPPQRRLSPPRQSQRSNPPSSPPGKHSLVSDQLALLREEARTEANSIKRIQALQALEEQRRFDAIDARLLALEMAGKQDDPTSERLSVLEDQMQHKAEAIEDLQSRVSNMEGLLESMKYDLRQIRDAIGDHVALGPRSEQGPVPTPFTSVEHAHHSVPHSVPAAAASVPTDPNQPRPASVHHLSAQFSSPKPHLSTQSITKSLTNEVVDLHVIVENLASAVTELQEANDRVESGMGASVRQVHDHQQQQQSQLTALEGRVTQLVSEKIPAIEVKAQDSLRVAYECGDAVTAVQSDVRLMSRHVTEDVLSQMNAMNDRIVEVEVNNSKARVDHCMREIEDLKMNIERTASGILKLVNMHDSNHKQAIQETEAKLQEAVKKLAELTLRADSESMLELRNELEGRMRSLQSEVEDINSQQEAALTGLAAANTALKRLGDRVNLLDDLLNTTGKGGGPPGGGGGGGGGNGGRGHVFHMSDQRPVNSYNPQPQQTAVGGSAQRRVSPPRRGRWDASDVLFDASRRR